MIRRLGPGDGPTFRAIRLEALHAEPAAYASTAADWERLTPAEWEHRATANPVVVSLDGPEPVGVMGAIPQSASKMAHRATIVMAYVRRSHRGQGRAAAMLAALAADASAAGRLQLELAVSAENPAALRFYDRMGFAVAGRIPGGFLHDGREIDEILMTRRLD